MGLASGGGGSGGGGGFGGGFAAGYLMGKGDIDPAAAIAIGAVTFLLIGGVVVAGIFADKATNEAKAQLNDLIATHMQYQSADVTYFDWYTNNDSEYLFKFTGSAMNMMGDDIDFFSCAYEVSEQQYYDVLQYIEKNDIEDLDTKGLLEKLTEIIKEAELVASSENENVATAQATTDERIILNVSKAKVQDDKVSYYVCYATEVRDEDGNMGLVTTVDEVSYDLTDELRANPNGAFLLSKDKAQVRMLKSNYTPVEQFSIMPIAQASAERTKVSRR